MKRNILTTVLLIFAILGIAAASGTASGNTAAMPRTLSNARFVYVTAYDGDQFDFRLLPEDRAAIGEVQDAIQKWGKLIVVYRPEDADVIIAVQSRPSEDVLAVYDARSGLSSTYLWRVMGRGGLQKGETPLISEFETAWNKMVK
jgi:hypothetical protein